MGIFCVGSFPVWSGGSLITSSSFRCRKLAITRGTSYTFQFILGVVGRHGGIVRHLGISGWLSVLGGHLYITHISIHPPYICITMGLSYKLITCSLMYGWLRYLCILDTVFIASVCLDWKPNGCMLRLHAVDLF